MWTTLPKRLTGRLSRCTLREVIWVGSAFRGLDLFIRAFIKRTPASALGDVLQVYLMIFAGWIANLKTLVDLLLLSASEA